MALKHLKIKFKNYFEQMKTRLKYKTLMVRRIFTTIKERTYNQAST